jgi:hypothetical protein
MCKQWISNCACLRHKVEQVLRVVACFVWPYVNPSCRKREASPLLETSLLKRLHYAPCNHIVTVRHSALKSAEQCGQVLHSVAVLTGHHDEKICGDSRCSSKHSYPSHLIQVAANTHKSTALIFGVYPLTTTVQNATYAPEMARTPWTRQHLYTLGIKLRF